MDVFKSVIIFKMSIIRIMLIKNDNRFKVRAACLLYPSVRDEQTIPFLVPAFEMKRRESVIFNSML